MASFNRGDNDVGDFDDKPSEEQVVEIFECFIECRLEIDRENNRICPSTPGLPPEDLPHTPDDRDNVAWQIGKELAKIADTLELDYENRNIISNIVNMVNIGPDDSAAFGEFKDIAQRVLKGGIDWNSVATLLYFGYCIARDRLTKGFQHFLSQLLQWILSIFTQFGIFDWITAQGGWRNFLRYSQGVLSRNMLAYGAAFVGFTALLCLVFYYRNSDTTE